MSGYVDGWDELKTRVDVLEAEHATMISYINNILVPYTQYLEAKVEALSEHTHEFVSGPPEYESPGEESDSGYGVAPYSEGIYGE